MTLGTQPHSLALAAPSAPGADPVELIEAAARAGFEGIGLRLYLSPGQSSPFVPVVGNAPLIRDIRGALAATGLKFWDVFSYYVRPDFDLDAMLPSFELGSNLGAQYVLVLANDPDFSRMSDNLGALAAAAKRFGLTVALEAPHTRLEVKTLSLALDLIAESRADNAVIVLDTNQFAKAGHTADLLRHQDARLFPYCQLTDSRPGEDVSCGPGQGSVPNAQILAALPEGVGLSAEWPPPSGSAYDVGEWVETVYRQMVAYLERMDA